MKYWDFEPSTWLIIQPTFFLQNLINYVCNESLYFCQIQGTVGSKKTGICFGGRGTWECLTKVHEYFLSFTFSFPPLKMFHSSDVMLIWLLYYYCNILAPQIFFIFWFCLAAPSQFQQPTCFQEFVGEPVKDTPSQVPQPSSVEDFQVSWGTWLVKDTPGWLHSVGGAQKTRRGT